MDVDFAVLASLIIAEHLPLVCTLVGPPQALRLCSLMLPRLVLPHNSADQTGTSDHLKTLSAVASHKMQTVSAPASHKIQTVTAVAVRSVRHLPCAVLGTTSVCIAAHTPPASADVVCCSVCDVDDASQAWHSYCTSLADLNKSDLSLTDPSHGLTHASSNSDHSSQTHLLQSFLIPRSSSQHKLNTEFFLPFYRQLQSPSPEVLLALIHALPSLVHHSTFTYLRLVQYLHLVHHDNVLVQSAAAKALPLLAAVRIADDITAGADESTFRFILQFVIQSTLDPGLLDRPAAHTGLILVIQTVVRLSTPVSCVYVLLALMHCLCLTKHRNVIAQAPVLTTPQQEVLHRSPPQVHLAVPALAERFSVSARQLFHRNRQLLCKVIVERASSDDLEVILSHAAELFRDSQLAGVLRYCDSSSEDLVDWTSSNFRHLLPGLVTRAVKECKPALVAVLLRCVNKNQEKDSRDDEDDALLGTQSSSVVQQQKPSSGSNAPNSLLIDHFQHIVVYAALFQSPDVLEKSIQYVADATGFHPVFIRRCSIQHQLNELILGLHDFKEKALRELECLSVLDGQPSQPESQRQLTQLVQLQQQIRRRPANQDAVQSFVSSRLLGILMYLDNKMVCPQSLLHERSQAVWAIAEVISVVGRKGVSSVARKLLATLKLALEHTKPSEWKRCAVACREFIFHLEPALLDSLVEEIVVTITPVVAKFPLTLGPTLNRIICKHPQLRPAVEPLPPSLPDVRQLHALISACRESKRKEQEGLTQSELLTALRPCAVGLRHESYEVRHHAVLRLLHLLRTHHALLCTAAAHHASQHDTRPPEGEAAGEDAVTAEGVLEQLTIALIGQCRSSSEDLQVLVAEALGLLGAMDPSRLVRTQHLTEAQTGATVHSSLTSLGFIRDLVTELARAFLSATDSNIQTCASFALQEILRIHNISDTASCSDIGSQVWRSLPSHVQHLLGPLQSSKYIISGAKTARSPAHTETDWLPVFGSKDATSFKVWMTTWMVRLLDLVEDENDFEVFSVCKPIFRRDTNTALHILPHLVMSVLLHSPKHHAKVATEVLAVLAGSENSSSIPVLPESREGADVQSLLLSERHMDQLCAETVFSVLDAITVWVQQRWKEEASSRRLKNAFVPSAQVQQVLDFLAVLPSDQLARSAFRCQAYTRALRHIEEHIRARPDALNSHLTFMQQIYSALDEPDGVKGIAGMRSAEPSVHDSILLYKADGRLHDALGCYEYLCSLKKEKTNDGKETGTNEAPSAGVHETDSVAEDPYVGLLQCYISLDQPQTVLDITHAILARDPSEESRLNEFRMEAAWRLFHWDDLENMLRVTNSPSVGDAWKSGVHSSSAAASSAMTGTPNKNSVSGSVASVVSYGEGVGDVLISAKKGDTERYLDGLRKLRKQLIPLIGAATMEKGAYQRAYPYFLKLHILSELDDLLSRILKIRAKRSPIDVINPALGTSQEDLDGIRQVVQKWQYRLDLVQTSYKNLEPVLSFRRTLLMLAKEMLSDGSTASTNNKSSVLQLLDEEVKKLWLHSAKVARKAGMLQQGETAFLHAGSGQEVFLERAKWLQAKGHNLAALEELKRGMKRHYPNPASYRTSDASQSEREAFSRAQLLLARYSEEAAILDVNSMMVSYRTASEAYKEYEDGHFHFAMYLDRILNYKKEKSVDYQYHIVASLCKSLSIGNAHVYESLPKMLGIWLDLGSLVVQHETAAKKAPPPNMAGVRDKLQQMNVLIGGTVDTLCLYQLMTALPQLVSRICHSHPGVFKQISSIIAALMAAYPQQCMWHMIAVSKGTTTVSVGALVRSLPRLLNEHNFSEVIVPTQHQMTVTLPAGDRHPPGGTGVRGSSSYNPFPSREVFIVGVEDQAEVMASLQMPKKITLRGSDGQKYIVMCKPKDDLRKDCRLMDFTRFVNRLLRRDPDARRRDLLIRTYVSGGEWWCMSGEEVMGKWCASGGVWVVCVENTCAVYRLGNLVTGQGVVPLNEECGLLEWVHDLHGLRCVLHKIYREKGIYMPAAELKLYMCKQDVSLETKLDIFINKLKARHPPVLGEWFFRTFPHPHTWSVGDVQAGDVQAVGWGSYHCTTSTSVPLCHRYQRTTVPLYHKYQRTTVPQVPAYHCTTSTSVPLYHRYQARRAYCHTAGVMSMVGYVLGLGDRHGENINLDSHTGHIVHVDFNCLFNKGETFDWPERVPFRLTHNMVEAMGHGALYGLFLSACQVSALFLSACQVSGLFLSACQVSGLFLSACQVSALFLSACQVSGLFLSACQHTMRIMRSEREALMSVVKPFIYDPLVEWSKGDKTAKNTGEISNEKAQLHVRNIELRLKGLIASKARGFNIPLSVEGQVSLLISDATSDNNLCQMYIGWAPYL
ncbi:Phosphatidylinositol 3-/4-kinase catalytic domain [Trinorchestia longiramus]|nr:Phosphatidylinositol 3-/4-kinase catalytic domain [Trinorchestia longiramus]